MKEAEKRDMEGPQCPPPPSRLGQLNVALNVSTCAPRAPGPPGVEALQNFEMRCGPAHDKYPGQILSADKLPLALAGTVSKTAGRPSRAASVTGLSLEKLQPNYTQQYVVHSPLSRPL